MSYCLSVWRFDNAADQIAELGAVGRSLNDEARDERTEIAPPPTVRLETKRSLQLKKPNTLASSLA